MRLGRCGFSLFCPLLQTAVCYKEETPLEVDLQREEAVGAKHGPDERDRPSSWRDIWRSYLRGMADSHARTSEDYRRRAEELEDEGG